MTTNYQIYHYAGNTLIPATYPTVMQLPVMFTTNPQPQVLSTPLAYQAVTVNLK